jgi:CDP-glucose 4,6-dehydratase
MVMTSGATPDPEFWSGKRILLTGHTGFKGGWLTIWLTRMGADVAGIALPPSAEPNLFGLAEVGKGIECHFCDITDRSQTAELVRQSRPEIVFHMAAQPLVRESYSDPVGTFAVNVMGTSHLLDALRDLESVRAVVVVTTDKVYRNQEWPFPYREKDRLGGHDPYSASKAASEMVAASYRDAFLAKQGAAVATARAGNVVGGGDWSVDRLIPDAVRAWSSATPLFVRRPDAVRPWQHVLDPLAGYICLAERLWADPSLSGAWNFGPDPHQDATVREVVQRARESYGKGEIQWGTDVEGPHEAGRLTLETAKARVRLSVRPRWGLDEAVDKTMAWYRLQSEGADARKLCEDQIREYEGAA